MLDFLRSEPHGIGAASDPYLPYPIAHDLGLVTETVEIDDPIGAHIANGSLPATSTGGAVLLGDQVWGVDFVAVRPAGKDLEIVPTDKASVAADRANNVGTPVAEGLMTLSTVDKVVFAGVSIACLWQMEALRQKGVRVSQIGRGLGVVGLNSLDGIQTRFDINDKDLTTGILKISEPNRFWLF